jgi:5'-phosphate synthase pdxT subunit
VRFQLHAPHLSSSACSSRVPPVSGRPTIGVLALQGDVREHVAMLHRAGAEAAVVRRPAELADVDGLVVPGGESTTMIKLARRFEMLAPLREAIGGGMPAYGTCAGMILLADRILDGAPGQETLGGLDVTVRRNAFGRQVDSFEGPVDVDGLEGSFHGVFIRAPWVEKAGQDVEVLASAAGHPVAVRQRLLLATSFHPEITGDHRMHALFLAMVTSR